MNLSSITFNNGYRIDLELKASFLERLKGLLGTEYLNKNRGIVLENCKQIHTFAMKFPIDVIVLDKNLNIIDFVYNMKPNRIGKFYWRGKYMIELSSRVENKEIFIKLVTK